MMYGCGKDKDYSAKGRAVVAGFLFPGAIRAGEFSACLFHSIMFRRMENFTMAMAVMLVRGMSCGE